MRTRFDMVGRNDLHEIRPRRAERIARNPARGRNNISPRREPWVKRAKLTSPFRDGTVHTHHEEPGGSQHLALRVWHPNRTGLAVANC